jgi:hypothetical protein
VAFVLVGLSGKSLAEELDGEGVIAGLVSDQTEAVKRVGMARAEDQELLVDATGMLELAGTMQLHGSLQQFDFVWHDSTHSFID